MIIAPIIALCIATGVHNAIHLRIGLSLGSVLMPSPGSRDSSIRNYEKYVYRIAFFRAPDTRSRTLIPLLYPWRTPKGFLALSNKKPLYPPWLL